jgi:hypothetical protein
MAANRCGAARSFVCLAAATAAPLLPLMLIIFSVPQLLKFMVKIVLK